LSTIEASDTRTVTGSESTVTNVKRCNNDNGIFSNVVRHTVETATRQIRARNYGLALESLSTVIKSEVMCGARSSQRYKILEMFGEIYCHQGRWDELEQILRELAVEEPSTLVKEALHLDLK
jgi:hypothetical protein